MEDRTGHSKQSPCGLSSQGRGYPRDSGISDWVGPGIRPRPPSCPGVSPSVLCIWPAHLLPRSPRSRGRSPGAWGSQAREPEQRLSLGTGAAPGGGRRVPLRSPPPLRGGSFWLHPDPPPRTRSTPGQDSVWNHAQGSGCGIRTRPGAGRGGQGEGPTWGLGML